MSPTQTVDDAGGIVSSSVGAATCTVWVVCDADATPAAGTDQAAYVNALAALNAGRGGLDYDFAAFYAYNRGAAPPTPTGVGLVIYCPSTDAAAMAGRTGIKTSVTPTAGAPNAANVGQAASTAIATWLHDYYLAGGKILAVGASAERLLAAAPFGFIKNRTAIARSTALAGTGYFGYRIKNQRNFRNRKSTRFAADATDSPATHKRWLDGAGTTGPEFPAGAGLTATQSFQIDTTGGFEGSTVIGQFRSQTSDGTVTNYGGDTATDTAAAVFTQLARKAACGRVYLLGAFGRSEDTGGGGNPAFDNTTSWDELLGDAADHLATPAGVCTTTLKHKLTGTADGSASELFRSFVIGEALTLRTAAGAATKALIYLGNAASSPDGFDAAALIVDGAAPSGGIAAGVITHDYTVSATLGRRLIRVLMIDDVNDPAAQLGSFDAEQVAAYIVYDWFRTASTAGAFDDAWTVDSDNPEERGDNVALSFALNAGWHDDDWPDGGGVWPNNAKHNVAGLTVKVDLKSLDGTTEFSVTGAFDGNDDGVYHVLVGDGLTVPNVAAFDRYYLTVTQP